MSKLSKSKQSDRVSLLTDLAAELNGGQVQPEALGPAAAVVDSEWFANARSAAFWNGVRELADLLGVELDEYTRQNLVDPYQS